MEANPVQDLTSSKDQTANAWPRNRQETCGRPTGSPLPSLYVLCEIGDDRSCNWSRQDRPDYNKLESKPPSTR